MAFSILVCIKAVPDLASGGTLTVDGPWIRETEMDWDMNPYDAYALEAALAIKDAHAHVTIDALSGGPDHVRPVIRRSMAMGADAGIHLSMASKDCLSPKTVARAIADFAREKEYDLILTGAVSEDLMQGITGPMIAAALDRPCAVAVIEIVPDRAGRSLDVACEMEGGVTERIRVCLPALVTVQTGGHRPRYPSLSNTLRSRRQTILQVNPGLVPPLLTESSITELTVPQPASACETIEGTPQEKADRLLQLFNDKGWLR